MRIFRSPPWRAALLTFGVLAACGGSALYRNWPALERYAVYEFQTNSYRSHRDPLLRNLAAGVIRPGDPIEPLIEMYPVVYVDRHDEFITVVFGPPGTFPCGGTTAVAKDGRLVCAVDGAHRFRHVFFNTLTPAEQAVHEASYAALMACEREKRHAVPHAVGGAAGVAFNHYCFSRPGDD